MDFHQVVSSVISKHKSKIETTQWAVMNGISSLLYSEYISNFKHKLNPVKHVLVPQLKTVEDILNPNGMFIEDLSSKFIDMMINNDLFRRYSNAPELVLFDSSNVDIMKLVFKFYIIPNVIKRIPETFALKFQLDNPHQQIIREGRDLAMFKDNGINNDHFRFIVDQSVLQLLILLASVERHVTLPEDYSNIEMLENGILSISNKNAICPIYINRDIIRNQTAMNLISFVSSTTVNENKSDMKYTIITNVFNEAIIITLHGIEINGEIN